MTDFDDYWHIGQAQILSGKITESDFKANIKEYVLKAREQGEGLVIKKYIMTLPMDIRRAIMKYDAERIAELKKGIE